MARKRKYPDVYVTPSVEAYDPKRHKPPQGRPTNSKPEITAGISFPPVPVDDSTFGGKGKRSRKQGRRLRKAKGVSA